jgi:glycosyltransferase involved in cell wall biosynthesis
MRIGIEASNMLATHLTGIEYSLTELVRHLPPADPSAEYVLYFNFRRGEYQRRFDERVRPLLGARLHACINRIPAAIAGRLHRHLRLPIEAALGRCDTVYYHCFDMKPQWFGARVVTIHDLMPMTHGEYYPSLEVAAFSRAVPRMIRRADAVIAVSGYTKTVIVERLGVPPERIAVVHHGVSDRFRRPPDQAIRGLRRRFGLVRPFLLFVGTAEPRKNLLRLLDAYAARRASGDRELEFVIAGKSAWGSRALRERIAALGLDREVRLLGHVDGGTLPALYAAAEVFALPSIAEGFGMPILEAMACGTPVIASHSTAMPEVYGDAALGFDPMDSDAIAAALARARDDRDLRRRMVERGLARARSFSWLETARRTVEVCRRVAR